MGRPRKKIDAKLVERLAMIDCSVEEIAAVVECSTDTLQRRFAAVMAKGRAQGKTSLRRAQFRLALKGNATMQIWLGKQRLGQKEPAADTPAGPSADALEIARQVRDAVREMRDADGAVT